MKTQKLLVWRGLWMSQSGFNPLLLPVKKKKTQSKKIKKIRLKGWMWVVTHINYKWLNVGIARLLFVCRYSVLVCKMYTEKAQASWMTLQCSTKTTGFIWVKSNQSKNHEVLNQDYNISLTLIMCCLDFKMNQWQGVILTSDLLSTLSENLILCLSLRYYMFHILSYDTVCVMDDLQLCDVLWLRKWLK